MKSLNVETRRGTVLNGVLFPAKNSDTVVIAITGIHGNFYSNPFYYNIGDTLSANKVIYYLSKHHDKKRVEKFILMSPANLTHMMSGVSDGEKDFIEKLVRYGQGKKILPFAFMGWVICTANTAHDWLSGILDNASGNFSQVEQITHTGALIIGTYDNFTDGAPVGFLQNINLHMRTAKSNELIFIEHTGHTYQQKHDEIAEKNFKFRS